MKLFLIGRTIEYPGSALFERNSLDEWLAISADPEVAKQVAAEIKPQVHEEEDEYGDVVWWEERSAGKVWPVEVIGSLEHGLDLIREKQWNK